LCLGVWVFVIGALSVSISHSIGSHMYLHGEKNRFCWNKNALQDAAKFGKWVFYSSILYMISIQGDRLLLAKYVEPRLLGIYSIAILLAEAAQNLTMKISTTVIFPAISKIINSEKQVLQSAYYRIRLGLDIFIVLPTACLLILAPIVVNFLYDQRYHEAGWIFRLLCIKLLMIAIVNSCEQCLIALGHPKYSTILNTFRAVWILAGIPLGWNLFGLTGLVAAVATTEIPVAIVLWSGMVRYRILRPILELRSFAFAVLGLVLGLTLLHILQTI
jgi:O-antigen/teichoic acid export membrane protein